HHRTGRYRALRRARRTASARPRGRKYPSIRAAPRAVVFARAPPAAGAAQRRIAMGPAEQRMEIDVDEFAEQRALFARLLRDAARRADEMLASPGEAVRLRCIADDGFSAIERLELSALVED